MDVASYPPVIFLMGPTAIGKTELAIELVEQLNGHIISVDSAMIYKEMDIGTAKPSAEELAKAPHELIDICTPDSFYSAAEFRRDALACIDRLYRLGKRPILAGGTMMYFKTLLEGLPPLPPSEPEVRTHIQEKLNQEGPKALHQWLQDIDPVSAQRLHENDSQRLSRAIEVFLISGVALSDWQQQEAETFPYPVQQYALIPEDRAWLHERIAIRFEKMLEMGFEAEVRQLVSRYHLKEEMPSMRCVGYRQMLQYLNQGISMDETQQKAVAATRQLAKRQLTWLRSWPNLKTFHISKNNIFPEVLKSIKSDTI